MAEESVDPEYRRGIHAGIQAALTQDPDRLKDFAREQWADARGDMQAATPFLQGYMAGIEALQKVHEARAQSVERTRSRSHEWDVSG